MKVFVSYTTIDKEITVKFLQGINDFLKSQGNVFIDLIHNDSTDKQKRVFYELENSDIVVLVNSKNVYNSYWVSKELDFAEKVGIPKLILFPSEIKFLPEVKLRLKIFDALKNNTATKKCITS
jgi:predicted nucleic acid-binding protein